ncbi:MAG: TMAO reductase system periplasmic protein TorT [Paracoccaceae bacterium]
MRHGYLPALLAAILCLCGAGVRPAMAEAGLVCVLVPHFKDEYWLSVAYGLEQEAARRGLSLRFFEAGGYTALQNQIAQLDSCQRLQPEAILIGAVSSDDPALLAAVARAAEAQPVIGLVNALQSPALAAHVGVDWRDMGLDLGRHLALFYPVGGPDSTAILLTGPAESGWVAPLERGLRDGLAGSALRITAVYGCDTGTAAQLQMLEQALTQVPDPDVIIGAAPAIEAAMAMQSAQPGGPVLAATYVTHSVARGLVGGQIAAAPFDDPIAQGVMAIDAVLAALAGVPQPGMVGPPIRVLTAGVDPADITLSPADYFPTLR